MDRMTELSTPLLLAALAILALIAAVVVYAGKKYGKKTHDPTHCPVCNQREREDAMRDFRRKRRGW